MANGLQVYSNTGAVIHDTNDRLTRLIGTAVISGAGSFQVPDFALGDGWAFTQAVDAFSNSLKTYPEFTISGTTLSWTTDSASPTPVNIFYGVY